MQMAVVALAPFVVESDHTHAVHGIDRAVLVTMA
jgi:hypothetical protein